MERTSSEGFRYAIVALLCLYIGAGINLYAEQVIPSGITDPGRSVWFQAGEVNDVVLGLKYETGLPTYRLSIAGVPAIAAYPPSQRIFLDVANWFSATNVILNIEYFDSGTGRIIVCYDSLDQNVIKLPPPVPAGAWKDASEFIDCAGTLQWKTASIHLLDARFSNECNPSWCGCCPDCWCDHEDLFVDTYVTGGPPIRAMWISAISNAAPLPRHQIEWVDVDGNVTARRAANDDDRFILSDTDYEYTFAPAGLLKIVHKPTQTILALSESPYIPCRLTIHKARTDLPVIMDEMPKTVRVIGGSQPTAIEYVLGCPEMLQATLRIEKVDGGLTHWKVSNLSLSPYEGTTLTDVSLPDLRGVAIGGDARDDWCIIPGYYSHGSGIYYDTIDANAPVPTAMHMAINWLSLYDQTNQCGIGFYLDDQYDLDSYQTNDVHSDAINIRFTCKPTLTTLPEAYVLVHSGTWHRVADSYRVCVASRDPTPPNPAWAADIDGWDGWPSNEIERGFCFIPDVYREWMIPRGLRLMDIYRQMYDGPWSYCGVYPYPNAYYGSAEELKEAALRVHDNGGRMIFYINYQLSTPDGPSVKRIGPTSRTLIPADIPPPYMPPGYLPITDRSYTGLPEEQFGNDRSSRQWSERDLYWVLWYAQNVSADGIYLDQLSCIPWGLKETAWNLGRITTEARKIVPDFITAGEGVGQAHGRNLTFGLASAVFYRNELYRYTFPEHLVMDGTANGACNWGGGDQRFNVIFLNGCRFDQLPQDETFRKNLVNLRLRTKQLLYQAMFRDTNGVDVAIPWDVPVERPTWFARYYGIQAKRFILNTSESKLVLVNTINTLNAGGAKATVETKEVGTINAAWAFLWDGTLQRIPFQYVSATEVAFDIPTTEQATVVLVNLCEPVLYVDVPTMLAPGGQGQASVSILNLNPSAIQGTLTWEIPEGWTYASAEFDSIIPGETQTVTMSLAASPNASRQIYDLWCVAATIEGVKGRKYTPVSVVPTPYVKWEYQAGESLRLTIQNLKNEVVTGSAAIEFPTNAIVGTIEKEQSFNVSGNSETILTFRFTNLSQLEEPIGIYILVQCGGTQQRVPIRLFPAIANGGFEIDLAGDGKPEYWTTYDYSGKTSFKENYPLINLDYSVKHSGNSSLRVDPLAVERDPFVFVMPLATMVFPNTHYQITAFAKVPANGSIIIVDWNPLVAVGNPTPDGWQLYAGEYKTGSSVYRNMLNLINNGSTTIWVDDIKMYRLGCAPKPSADLTNDCVVDYADLKVMVEQWVTSAAIPTADLNADSEVDFKDFAKLAQGWLEEIPWL
jgi:hypothetical protein